MSKESILDKLNKTYGTNSVQKVKYMNKTPVRRDSTGSWEIDSITGGGLLRARLIEIIGWESSGKTTLTLQAIAQKQKALIAEKDTRDIAFIDMEHALDLTWAETLGVNIQELVIAQPNNGEEALEIAYNLSNSGEFAMVVLDSVAAARPKKEIEGEMGDAIVGLQAKLMSQACPKLSISADKNDCTTIMINQFREKIGITFGSPETTPAGNALKFYAGMRLDIRNIGAITDSDNSRIGNHTRVKCIKNKGSAPFGVCDTRLYYGLGIDRRWEVYNIAVQLDVIKKSGSWISFGDIKLQGENNFLQVFREDFDLQKSVEHLVNQELQNV